MGNIKVIKGSMNAGKSAMAIIEIMCCRLESLKVLVLKPGQDTRDQASIKSRLVAKDLPDGIPADMVIGVDEDIPIKTILQENYDRIVVDEFHMLTVKQIQQLNYIVSKCDTDISLYGLTISKTGEPFPSAMYALAYADEIVLATSANKARENKMYHVKYVKGIPADIHTDELIECGDIGTYDTVSRKEFYTIYDKVFRESWGI